MTIARPQHFLRLLGTSIAVATLLLAALLLLLQPATPAGAQMGLLFAQPSGSGTACSQALSCDLHTALDMATDGDTIYMAEGNYTGAPTRGGESVIDIRRSITLAGGWDGTTTTPPVCDPDRHPSTVDGQGVRRGVTISGPLTVTLQGLTIRNGVHDRMGAGLYALSVDLTLRHMAFISNVIDSTVIDSNVIDSTVSGGTVSSGTVSDSPYGGGAAVEWGAVRVEDSAFVGNSVRGKGGPTGGGLVISRTQETVVEDTLFQGNDAWITSGLAVWGSNDPLSTVIVRRCRFEDNGWGFSPGQAKGGYYGALVISESHARVEDNLFLNNWTGNGRGAVAFFRGDLQFDRNVIAGNSSHYDASALYAYRVSPFTVTNNLIADNQSEYSWRDDDPAVQIEYGSGQLLHNTIARNGNDYGIRIDRGAAVTLTNNILVSHTFGISVATGCTATLDGTLWGAGEWANGSDWTGEGVLVTGTVNIWDEPGFSAPEDRDYHLAPLSAAIDAGANPTGGGVGLDIDGDPRPIGGGADIGADEWDPARPAPTVTSTPTLTPTPTPRPTSTPTPETRPLYLPLLERGR